MRLALAILVLAVCAAVPVRAQVGGLGLPDVRGTVGDVTGQLPDVRETAERASDSPRQLVQRRRELTRDLIRDNRRTLEADPQGHAIARSQILALDMNAEAQAAAEAAGFEIVRRDDL
ncbi:MAG: hypothetical protein R3C16_06615, partial [Hyphomonadaceae bacterium]